MMLVLDVCCFGDLLFPEPTNVFYGSVAFLLDRFHNLDCSLVLSGVSIVILLFLPLLFIFPFTFLFH